MTNDSLNQKCGYCGSIHATKCPLIKAIEYHGDGTTKRVEFYTPTDYQEIQIRPDPVKAMAARITDMIGTHDDPF